MNRLMLPGCLNFFQNIDGKTEHSIKVAKPIILEWHFIVDRNNPEWYTGAEFTSPIVRIPIKRAAIESCLDNEPPTSNAASIFGLHAQNTSIISTGSISDQEQEKALDEMFD